MLFPGTEVIEGNFCSFKHVLKLLVIEQICRLLYTINFILNTKSNLDRGVLDDW
jgi:hypothetical protein